MRKHLLRALTILFVTLLMHAIHAAEEPYVTIRSSYADISVSQVQSIPNSNRQKGRLGVLGS